MNSFYRGAGNKEEEEVKRENGKRERKEKGSCACVFALRQKSHVVEIEMHSSRKDTHA